MNSSMTRRTLTALVLTVSASQAWAGADPEWIERKFLPAAEIAEPAAVPVMRWTTSLPDLLHRLLAETGELKALARGIQKIERAVDAVLAGVSAALGSDGAERHVQLVMAQAAGLDESLDGGRFLESATKLRATLSALVKSCPEEWMLPKLTDPAARKDWETFAAAQHERLGRIDEEYSRKKDGGPQLRMLLRGLEGLAKNWQDRHPGAAR